MKKLGSRGQKWLKLFHILSAGVWVGTAVSLSVKQFFINPVRDAELFGILSTLDFIDLFILVPGAIGTFLSVFRLTCRG